jgi:hypothetical protein
MEACLLPTILSLPQREKNLKPEGTITTTRLGKDLGMT